MDEFGFVKLKDVCTFYTGTGFPTKYQGRERGKYPFYKVGDISKNAQAGNKYLQLCDNFVDDEDVVAIKGNIIPSNTIVFAKIGEAVKLNRRAITETSCLVDNNVMGIAPDESEMSLDYFYYFMRNFKMETLAESTTVPSVRKSRLEELKIQVPTLDIQEIICKKLNSTERIMVKRRQQLEELDMLIKARFVELFGDPNTNPHSYQTAEFGTVLIVEPQNGLYKPQSDYVTDGNGIPILRIDGFYDGKVTDFRTLKRLICSEDDIKRYELHENDIVINRVNSIEYLGKCGLIQGLVEKTVFESNMMRLHVDESKLNPCYISHFLCSQYIYQQILKRAKKSVNQASINQKDVQSFVICIPPIELQTQFADFVTQVDKLKVEVQKSLDKLQMLFDSLMQRYFG